MSKKLPEILFTLEMANNHMGDVDHGIHLISTFGKICRNYPFNFSFKFQYRSLDTFIHPSMKKRDDIKYIKRFSETKLPRKHLDKLVDQAKKEGFLTMSTPFDQESVDTIESQNLDIIKIASCSFSDWPLLERIIEADKPVIASTAGAAVETIDQVVSFLSHRNKEFAIMHCVGQYPTPEENMHLSQINYLKQRYPNIRIGFSTHEDPNNTSNILMAMAMGATIFEKHVAIATDDYKVNNYSATPDQLEKWLDAALYSKKVCGISNQRLPVNSEEKNSLRSLQRGAFARRKIKKGEQIKTEDVYFAFPPQENQFTANEWSKYFQYLVKEDINKDAAIGPKNVKREDTREKVWEIVKKVRSFLKKSQVIVPGGAELEISHHYGLDKFDKYGLMMLTVINRDYCKKLLVTLPGQSHPEQYHKQKEETFHVLYGEMKLELDGQKSICKPGDVITVLPGVRHAFSSDSGAVVEELSTTHFKDDSYYTDQSIMENMNRKTMLAYWME